MKDILCPLPWISLAVRNTGQVRVCCFANVSKGKGLLRQESGAPVLLSHENIPQIRNHALLKEIRRSMLEGKWHPACGRCQTEEDSGLQSKRLYSRNSFEPMMGALREKTALDGGIKSEEFPILDADFRFGNRCNLACRMCGPTDSSKWYGDHNKVFGSFYTDGHQGIHLRTGTDGRITAEPNPYSWHQNPQLWQGLAKALPNIRKIYFAGGEPLMIPEHELFLETLAASPAAKNITIEYNTNLTLLPPRILELWKSFQEIRLGVSMDGRGEVNEYIRYPSSFPKTLGNLETLARQNSHLVYWMACTISSYNIWHFPDFLEWVLLWAKSNPQKRRPFPLALHFVHNPDTLNIRFLSIDTKKHLTIHLESARDAIRSFCAANELKNLESTALEQIDKVLRFMNRYTEKNREPALRAYTAALDSIRGQSFAQSQKEMAALLGL